MPRKPKEYPPLRVTESHPPDATEEDFLRVAAQVQGVLRRAYEKKLKKEAHEKGKTA